MPPRNYLSLIRKLFDFKQECTLQDSVFVSETVTLPYQDYSKSYRYRAINRTGWYKRSYKFKANLTSQETSISFPLMNPDCTSQSVVTSSQDN